MLLRGATQASALANIRKMFPDHFLLVPGVDSQGGTIAEVAQHGMNKDAGLLVNVSRSIIFAGNGHDFAQQARDAANKYRNEMERFLPPS